MTTRPPAEAAVGSTDPATVIERRAFDVAAAFTLNGFCTVTVTSDERADDIVQMEPTHRSFALNTVTR
jgi:hypothetical protein